jgi:cytosine/uracil/thiamine/allantoin permease
VNQQAFPQVSGNSPEAIPTEMRRIEGREWWLWGFTFAVTLTLTLGIISFTIPWLSRETDASYWFNLREWVRGLAALVLLFDFYSIYQTYNSNEFDANWLSAISFFSLSVKMPQT